MVLADVFFDPDKIWYDRPVVEGVVIVCNEDGLRDVFLDKLATWAKLYDPLNHLLLFNTIRSHTITIKELNCYFSSGESFTKLIIPSTMRFYEWMLDMGEIWLLSTDFEVQRSWLYAPV